MLKQLLLMSWLCLPVSAGAQENADQVSVSVSYADLDLSGQAGQQRLDARVRAALHKACEGGDEFSLSGKLAKRQCMSVAKGAAAAQVAAALASARNRTDLASK